MFKIAVEFKCLKFTTIWNNVSIEITSTKILTHLKQKSENGSPQTGSWRLCRILLKDLSFINISQ